MHEMSLAIGLMEQIQEVAQQNNLKCVDEVELQTGVLRQVIPEVMQEAFKAVTQETIAQNAKLTIFEIAALAQCNMCQKKFSPQFDDFLCPDCHKADVTVLQGDEIILKSIISNQEDGDL